jgi:CitMHS family citrate-Mg2+:H+ or citrate-Ca2+:H+ symporter
MITTAAMLPLYRRLGIRPIILACVTMLAGGVMNILPWGGPTARAASALGIDASQIFVPMIPAMIAGTVWVLFVARFLGIRERRRLAVPGSHDLPETEEIEPEPESAPAPDDVKRPHLSWFNALLTTALMVALLTAVLPLPVLFMVAAAIAMTANYPSLAEQKARLNAHAGNILSVVGLIFAAGIFTGILSGTKMVDAMASSVVHLVPPAFGPYLAVVTAVLSIPFTFFISNDAFYFGVLPILAKAGAAYGITAAEMGRAAVVGQPVHLLSPLVPSTYLLVGLVEVDLGDHQRFTLTWAMGSALVLLLTALLLVVIPFARYAP